MMKNSVLIVALLLAITSCKKESFEEIDSNSFINMEAITFEGMNYVDSIIGQVNFEFIREKDDGLLDTIKFTEWFNMNALVVDRKYNFNTPDKIRSSHFSIRFNAYGGKAQKVFIKKFTYTFNGSQLIKKEIELNDIGQSTYVSPTISYEF